VLFLGAEISKEDLRRLKLKALSRRTAKGGEMKLEHKILPCGCWPGEFLCPEAEKLWKEVKRTYEQAEYKGGSWEAYRIAIRKYNQHREEK